MTFKCILEKKYSPISPEQSVKAFIEAFEETSNLNSQKKHLNDLETELQTRISQNLVNSHSGIKPKDFHLELKDNKIYLTNTSKGNYATKYEYGYKNHSPYSYIKPSAIAIGNKISDMIIQETLQRYEEKVQGKSNKEASIPNVKTNYTNKYKH